MIRFYKGKYKVKRLSPMTPMKTALYVGLEDGPPECWKKGEQVLFPVRMGWRKRKSTLKQNKF